MALLEVKCLIFGPLLQSAKNPCIKSSMDAINACEDLDYFFPVCDSKVLQTTLRPRVLLEVS